MKKISLAVVPLLLASTLSYSIDQKSTQLTSQNHQQKFTDLVTSDRDFIASFSAFTGVLYVAASGVDKNTCDPLDELYNRITDDAWTTPSRENARLWNHIHQKAFLLWKSAQTYQSVFNSLRVELEKQPDQTVIKLAQAYSPLVERLAKEMNLTELNLSVFWSEAIEKNFSDLLAKKRIHDRLASNLDVLKLLNKEVTSEYFTQSNLDKNTIEGELKTYLTMVVKHYFSTGGIRSAVDDLSLPEPSQILLKEILAKQVTTLTDKVIDNGIAQIVTETTPSSPSSVEYIADMIKKEKLFDISDVEDDENLIIGEPVLSEQTLEAYLRKFKSDEFLVLMGGSQTATSIMLKKYFLKPWLLTPVFSKIGFDTTFNDYPKTPGISGKIFEKLIVDMSSQLLKDTVRFVFKGIEFYLVPKAPLKQPIGITLKNGKYFHVYADKKPLSQKEQIAQIIKSFPIISEKDLISRELKIGEPIIFTETPERKIAKAVSEWFYANSLESFADFTVKMVMGTITKQFDNKFNTNVHYARGKDHIWDDDELYIGIKIGQDVSKRLIKHFANAAFNKISHALKPNREICGVIEKDGNYFYVYK